MTTEEENKKIKEQIDLLKQRNELDSEYQKTKKSLSSLTNEEIEGNIRLRNAEIDLAIMRGDRLEAENKLFELEKEILELNERRIPITQGMTESRS